MSHSSRVSAAGDRATEQARRITRSWDASGWVQGTVRKDLDVKLLSLTREVTELGTQLSALGLALSSAEQALHA